MLQRNSSTLESARSLKRELLGQIRPPHIVAAAAPSFGEAVAAAYVGRLQNVVGVGYGVKITDGQIVPNETAVRVYVRKKVPVKDISINYWASQRIPKFVNGAPTDVIEVGDVSAGAVTRTYIPTTECGVSAAHVNVTAGTLGCLVKDSKTGDEYILSCNHIFANCNSASLNDDILQASPNDLGPASNPLGKLAKFKPIDFNQGAVNHIDAAISSICKPTRAVTPSIMAFGKLTLPHTTGFAPSEVLKYGRTTGPTEGQLVDVAADISITYTSNQSSADFEDQLAIQDGPSALSANAGIRVHWCSRKCRDGRSVFCLR